MAGPVPGPHYTQACIACVKAKRKCTRESPACLRCRSRGTACSYEKSKYSTSWVLLPESPSETSSLEAHSPPEVDADTALRGWDPLVSLDETEAHTQLSGWFTSLYTWRSVRSQRLELDAFEVFDLDLYVNKVREWLDQWTRTGATSFIHPQLYRYRFPRSVQDAFMCLSCYQNKTSDNEHLVFNLVEERSRELLFQYGYNSDAVPFQNNAKVKLDLMDHIARVQALLVFEFIGLFDGNIRLRHLAQRRTDLMLSWTQELVAVASSSVPSGVTDILAPPANAHYVEKDFMESLWHSWIVSETVRRTWNVMSSMRGLFSILQTSHPAPCAGGMMFTTRLGVWEARTAMEWQELCMDRPVGFLQVTEASKLIDEAEAMEINDFAKTILELRYGKERIQQWIRRGNSNAMRRTTSTS